MIKKVVFIVALLSFLGCVENNLPENCIRPTSFSTTKSLENPEFNQARTINGTAEILGGFKGILVINVGLEEFLAYDKICPNNDCNSPMVFNTTSIPVLECLCDGSKYGISKGIGGASQTPGFECPAIEYNVVKFGSSIRISNF
jgi:Rieske Fe-S protein